MKKTKNLITKAGKLLLVFGIVFSQLSFPLSVLADELATGVANDSEEVMEQNENEIQDEQNINTNGKTTEEQNKEEINPEEINFTVEILETEEQNLYIIKNELNKTLTVNQIKEENNAVTTIINKENVEVTDENEVISNGYQVTITEEELTSKTYTVIILGDYNEDGMVTIDDQGTLLDILKTTLEDKTLDKDILFLDLNKDEKFDILDVTYPIFTEGTWENTHVATDNLTNYLMASDEEVYIDEEIEVNYYIEGFEFDNLVGIQGKINYDKSLLELTKIQVNGVEQDVQALTNDNFIYLLEDCNQDGAIITFTFKALSTGTPNVSLENLVASIGGTKALLDVDKSSTTFNNLEYGKGGNEEEDSTTTESTTPTETTESVTETNSSTSVVAQTTSNTVLLSNDNDIQSLIIEGYDIEFDPNTYEYSIKVKSDVSALNLTVLLNSDKAIYYVEGNENFEVGENLVYIVVKAENGSTKTYTIKVEKEQEKVTKETNKEDTKEEEDQEEKSASKTVIIILIILVIIGLIYVIFKDDEEDTKDNKKEVKKTDKKESKK